MDKLSLKILKIDEGSMVFIYCIDLLISIIFINLIWHQPAENMFFAVFYTFSRGMTILITFTLLRYIVIQKRHAPGMVLLFILAIIQIPVLFVDIAHYGFNSGSFGSAGYIYMICEAILAVIYMRRYLVLRVINNQTIDELQQESSV